MMQVIGDMPPLPTPTVTQIRVPIGERYFDFYANGTPMRIDISQMNSVSVSSGNDLRHNRKEIPNVV